MCTAILYFLRWRYEDNSTHLLFSLLETSPYLGEFAHFNKLNLYSPCCSGKLLIFHQCKAFLFYPFNFSSIPNDSRSPTHPGRTILGLMNR